MPGIFLPGFDETTQAAISAWNAGSLYSIDKSKPTRVGRKNGYRKGVAH